MMEAAPTPSYYMVRTKHRGTEGLNLFFERSVVAVGWSRVPFCEYPDPEDAVRAVRETYAFLYDAKPRTRGRKLNEVRRFVSFCPGDRIVVPIPGAVRLASAKGKLLHDPNVGEDTYDLANQQQVTYLRQESEDDPVTIPRRELTEGLQRRLRVRGSTVLDLFEFKDEIERLFENRCVATVQEDALNRQEASFKQELLQRIQSGNTHLTAGGAGLERLVKELLNVSGYAAEILTKRAFPGFADADIKATLDDPLHKERQFLIQVKHHQGYTGTWGAEQLAELAQLDDETTEGADLVLITSALASEELAERCTDEGILLIDGEELVAWIFEALPRLHFETRQRLGISEVPRFLSETH